MELDAVEEKHFAIKIYKSNSQDSHRRGIAKRFQHVPVFSLVALILILGLCGAIVAIIVTSDGQVVEEWDSSSSTAIRYQDGISISVNVWISGLLFFAGKLVALVFAEAVTTAWWVKAMKGRKLRQLAHDFEASRSITAVLKSPRLFSWICLASIAFTGFGGLGMILQKATGTRAAERIYHGTTMHLDIPTRMPFGWSGRGDGTANTMPWFSPEMGRIVHDYQQHQPIRLPVRGCPQDNSSICSTTFHGLGFQFDCSASRANLIEHEVEDNKHPHQTLWAVGVNWYKAPFKVAALPSGVSYTSFMSRDKINLFAFWKNGTGTTGEKLVVQNCILTPALVQYPIKLANNEASLYPASSTVNWLTPHDGIPDMPADRVLHTFHNASAESEKLSFLNAPTTWGGIARLFWSLWASEITYSERGPNWKPFLKSTSLFASTYQLKSKWENPDMPVTNYPWGADYNKYDDPLIDIANGIRDIMFRISVEVSKGNINDTFVNTEPSGSVKGYTSPGPPPVAQYVDTQSTIVMSTNVYESHYLYLWLGVGLMLLAVAVIVPLFWDFWSLGHKFSLSPLELATARHLSAKHPYSSSESSIFDTPRSNTDLDTISNTDAVFITVSTSPSPECSNESIARMV